MTHTCPLDAKAVIKRSIDKGLIPKTEGFIDRDMATTSEKFRKELEEKLEKMLSDNSAANINWTATESTSRIDGGYKYTMKIDKEETATMNLFDLMKLVDNQTVVRIEVRGEELHLSAHRLSLYGGYRVKKLFVNCQGELDVVLEGN